MKPVYQAEVILFALSVRIFTQPLPLDSASAGFFPGRLPAGMRLVLTWGQRPEWEKDGRHLIFLEKGFGDVFRLDLSTGETAPLTHHFFHEGFERALVLSNGDLLLCGGRPFDAAHPRAERHRLEMWVLTRPFDKPPMSLGEFCDEGPAVSRKSLRIAWTTPGQREIKTGEIGYADGAPRLSSSRVVLSYADSGLSVRLETQDFRPPEDRELIFTHYSGTPEEPFRYAEVCGLDLATGAMHNYSLSPGTYEEAEGVFPNGRSTLMEGDRLKAVPQWDVDIYRLALDGSGHAERLTFFTDVAGFQGSNPVVSPDGSKIAFQLGIKNLGPGNGRGLYILNLDEAGATHR